MAALSKAKTAAEIRAIFGGVDTAGDQRGRNQRLP